MSSASRQLLPATHMVLVDIATNLNTTLRGSRKSPVIAAGGFRFTSCLGRRACCLHPFDKDQAGEVG